MAGPPDVGMVGPRVAGPLDVGVAGSPEVGVAGPGMGVAPPGVGLFAAVVAAVDSAFVSLASVSTISFSVVVEGVWSGVRHGWICKWGSGSGTGKHDALGDGVSKSSRRSGSLE